MKNPVEDMADDERRALEAGIQEALEQAERGELRTWEQSEAWVLSELAKRKREKAA